MIDEEGIIKPKSTEESRKVYFDDDPDIVSERIFPKWDMNAKFSSTP